MWRWVVKDYFSAFGWYRISALMKAGNWFWVIYWFAMLPAMFNSFGSWEDTLTFYLMMIPIFFCLTSEIFHRNRLPKIFYICPMEKEIRKAYIERKFLFSILFPSLLGGVAAVALWGFKLCHPLTAVLYFFDVLVISIFIGGIFKQTVQIPENSAIRLETVETNGVIEGAAYILSLIAVFGMYMMLEFGPSIEVWCKWIFVGFAVVLQLPLTIKGLTGWNAAVERALSYEVVKIKAKKVGGK